MMLHHRSNSSQTHPRRKAILSLFVIGFFLGVKIFFSHQLENNLDHQLLDTRNNALRSSSSPWSSTHNFNDAGSFKKVSYVTSFWAKTPQTKIHPHRREIEAALLANIYNPHIDQVVVFLDGVTTDENVEEEFKSSCVHFYQDMAEINHQFLHTSSTNTHGVDPMSKVTCVNVITGQPTYHQMFLNALSNVVTGDIVIMANAGMAFDDSIAKARKLKEDVLLVLGTSLQIQPTARIVQIGPNYDMTTIGKLSSISTISISGIIDATKRTAASFSLPVELAKIDNLKRRAVPSMNLLTCTVHLSSLSTCWTQQSHHSTTANSSQQHPSNHHRHYIITRASRKAKSNGGDDVVAVVMLLWWRWWKRLQLNNPPPQ
eukprot:scaffold21519_cov169-Skeletonema_dohrnii-CCMP3373.AAC.1